MTSEAFQSYTVKGRGDFKSHTKGQRSEEGIFGRNGAFFQILVPNPLTVSPDVPGVM